MSISKIFIPNCVCVLTNERYKTYQTGVSFCHLDHAPGVGLWGTRGAQGVNSFFFQAWSCCISNLRGWRAEQNASKIFILGSNLWLGVRSKGQISLNLVTMSILKLLYQTLCVFSQIKDRKHIKQNFHSVAGGCPWSGGVKNLSLGFAMAPPSTACSSFNCAHYNLMGI